MVPRKTIFEVTKEFTVALPHVCNCTSKKCHRKNCGHLKTAVEHVKTCQKRQQKSCNLCDRLIPSFIIHGMRCEEYNCNVPFCLKIRVKMVQYVTEGLETISEQASTSRVDPAEYILAKKFFEHCRDWSI